MNIKMRAMMKFWVVSMVLILPLLWQGCAHQGPLPQEERYAVYTAGASADPIVAKWAPAFLTYGYHDTYNRIGEAVARSGEGNSDAVDIDTTQPTVYVMQRTFKTDQATYTNLIYRVHFPGVPYSLIPFNLTAGHNVGLMVVVTLNGAQQPVLVTTVHTCGCYKAFIPTTYLPADALPKGWDLDHSQRVYGEQLASQIDYEGSEEPVLLVHLRPEVHRVMTVEVVPAAHLHSDRYNRIAMSVEPADALWRLPAGDGPTSFYYKKGWRKGHVKGSTKPFETIFLSLISLDLFVGSDKVYADPDVSGNRFYTSLKPWRREDSDMWDFARFLDYWGWHL